MKVVTLLHDPDLPNPATDFDGQWTPYSFNRRHTNYADPERFFPNGRPTIGLRRKLDVGLAFVLSYQEHGQSRWFRSRYWSNPRGMAFDFDTRHVAGILIWEHPARDMGARTYAERADDADLFLETYTAWANGDGYFFRVDDEAEDGTLTEIDSSGSYFGNDVAYMMRLVAEAVGYDPDVRFVGDAAYLQDQFVPFQASGAPHGPWSPREAARLRARGDRTAMDLDEAAVWSDWATEHGREHLAVDYEELERLRRALEDLDK